VQGGWGYIPWGGFYLRLFLLLIFAKYLALSVAQTVLFGSR